MNYFYVAAQPYWPVIRRTTRLKEKASLKHIVLQSEELYKPWILIQIWSKIGGELRKLWTTEYFNIRGMGAAILNI